MLRHNEEINNRNRDWNAGDKKNSGLKQKQRWTNQKSLKQSSKAEPNQQRV